MKQNLLNNSEVVETLTSIFGALQPGDSITAADAAARVQVVCPDRAITAIKAAVRSFVADDSSLKSVQRKGIVKQLVAALDEEVPEVVADNSQEVGAVAV